MADRTNLPAVPQQPLPPDLLKEMAMDVGKEVAAYVERMYPKAVEAAPSTFLLSIRNCIYNEIMAAVGARTIGEIEQRLAERKHARRKLRAMYKAVRTIQPGDYQKAEDVVAGRIPQEPDL